jgi:hypothetical protein
VTLSSILHQPPLPTKTTTQSHPRIALLQTTQHNTGDETGQGYIKSRGAKQSRAKHSNNSTPLPGLFASLLVQLPPFLNLFCTYVRACCCCVALSRSLLLLFVVCCSPHVAAALVIVPPGPVWSFPVYPHIQLGSFPSTHTSQLYPFTLAIRHSSTLFQLLHTPSLLQAPTSSNFILRRQTLDAVLSL